MKPKFYLSLIAAFLMTLVSLTSFSQCPNTVLVSNGGTCISISWPGNEVPSPLPASVSVDGVVYLYSNGLGVSGFPAVYVSSGAGCQLPIESFTGNLVLNFAAGPVTCQYGVVLALHDISLSASSRQHENLITWSSWQDNEAKTYEIQRSADGQHFSTIRVINATGNANGPTAYSFSDDKPLRAAFYRIKVNEKNGTAWFSKIVQLRNELIKSTLSVYPNPNKGNFILTGISASEIPTLAIVDVQGRRVGFAATKINDANQSVTITVKGNTSGVMVARYLSGSTTINTRFVVQ